jgi:hypothetical protein
MCNENTQCEAWSFKNAPQDEEKDDDNYGTCTLLSDKTLPTKQSKKYSCGKKDGSPPALTPWAKEKWSPGVTCPAF